MAWSTVARFAQSMAATGAPAKVWQSWPETPPGNPGVAVNPGKHPHCTFPKQENVLSRFRTQSYTTPNVDATQR